MTLAPLPAHPRRLAFLGTPAIAVPPLEALVQHQFDVAVVVTRPDKRRGRGGRLQPSPVKEAATALGLPVVHRVDEVLGADVDLGVVVAFGQLIRPHVLEAVPMINIHFSLLPRWRGAAPVERALLAGDDETGVCLMQVEEGLDTGGVLGCVRLPIAADSTAAGLRAELTRLATDLVIQQLQAGLSTPTPQTGETTYADKIEPGERHLDWSRPAVELDRLIRLGEAWTTFRGQRLKVLSASLELADQGTGLPPGTFDGDVVVTGAGRLRLHTVQPEGRPAMSAAAWRNGARVQPGERLGGA